MVNVLIKKKKKEEGEGEKNLLEVTDKFRTSYVRMVSWVYPYLQTPQDVYIKYAQAFTNVDHN